MQIWKRNCPILFLYLSSNIQTSHTVNTRRARSTYINGIIHSQTTLYFILRLVKMVGAECFQYDAQYMRSVAGYYPNKFVNKYLRCFRKCCWNFGKINFLLISLPNKETTSQLTTYRNNKMLDANDSWNKTTSRRSRAIWYVRVSFRVAT